MGLVALALALVLALAPAVRAEESAVVKKERTNVRAQASAGSEVITQLKKGENVTVLEEITPKKHKRGEPAQWLKIRLPSNTPVWVYAPYVETNNHTVNIKRLNLRAGPGENFSVIGRIERGTPVKEIRTDGNWMEIEAPPVAFAFVSADLLERQAAPAPGPADLAANTQTNVAPAQPAPTLETVKTEPIPAPAVETTNTTPNTTPTTSQPAPATTATTPTPAPVDTTPPKRVVSREGTVIVSRSIQAPTAFALENRESRRTVNYLHSESDDINLKKFAGKKVVVSGEELVDQRWINTPIIEVESIQVLR